MTTGMEQHHRCLTNNIIYLNILRQRLNKGIIMHQDLKNLPLIHNTCTPSWEGIPNALKLTILDFLSPTEALPGITAYKDYPPFGKYIVQQLRSELCL